MATLKRIIAAGRSAGTTLVGNQHAERFAALGARSSRRRPSPASPPS
jgi:hypothetical protein